WLIKNGRSADVDMGVPQLGSDSQSLVAQWFRAIVPFLPRRWQGRLAELDEPLQAVIGLTKDLASPFDRHRGHIAQTLRMIVLAETDRVEEARALFEAFADRHLAGLHRDSYWLTTIAILADVCALVGDRARAGVLYDLLSPYEGRNVSPGSSPFY